MFVQTFNKLELRLIFGDSYQSYHIATLIDTYDMKRNFTLFWPFLFCRLTSLEHGSFHLSYYYIYPYGLLENQRNNCSLRKKHRCMRFKPSTSALTFSCLIGNFYHMIHINPQQAIFDNYFRSTSDSCTIFPQPIVFYPHILNKNGFI